MAWYLRKSLNFGPLRLNFSKSGIGASVGVKGARVSLGPHGTYLHGGRGGLYFRQKLGTISRDRMSWRDPPAQQSGEIVTAPASRLTDSASEWLLDELNRRHQKLSIYSAVATLGILANVGALVLCLSLHPLWLILLCFTASATVVGLILARRKDIERKTMMIDFDLTSEGAAAFADWEAALGRLQSCGSVWRLRTQRAIADWKHNSGASHLVTRNPVRLWRRLPPHVKSNLVPFSLDLEDQALYFFPDRLLVYEGSTIGGVAYSNLIVETGASRFHEDGPVPRDSQVVGKTWRFVNKDGGPDRRFKYNEEIPICLYGELLLLSNTGMNILLQTSSQLVPGIVQSALERMLELCVISQAAETLDATGHDDTPVPKALPPPPNGQILVWCPHCERQYLLRSTEVGRRAKCKCGQTFIVQECGEEEG